jgi:metal-dependent amidase/aminoacylase/carboxypeptidase family protein
MNEAWRQEGLELIEKQIKLIVESHGGSAELEISKGYPYLENDPFVTAKTKSKAIELLGTENVEDLPIRLTSEDFAFYSHKVPVCFFSFRG